MKITKDKEFKGLKVTYEVTQEECDNIAKMKLVNIIPDILMADLIKQIFEQSKEKKATQ